MHEDINVNVSGPIQPTATYKTKVLKGNHSFASQVTEPNMKYVIKHDFVLDGDITIPANCVLEFDGGSISGAYTLLGQNTCIEAGLVKIFNSNVIIAGIWNIAEAYPEWFGAVGDGVTDDSEAIQKCISLFDVICLTKLYFTTSTINISGYRYKTIFGFGRNGITERQHSIRCGIKSTASVIINIAYDSERFVKSIFKDFAIQGTSDTEVGMQVEHLSNALFENLQFQNISSGIGLSYHSSNNSFNAQYPIVSKCTFGLCKIGISLTQTNGLYISECYFDGNDNNNINEFLPDGYINNSIAISIKGGDTNNITLNCIQGYHYGIVIESSDSNKITNNRFESVALGIYIKSGASNYVGKGQSFNNYILANLKQISRYGAVGYIKGTQNLVENIIYKSSYGMLVDDGNCDETGEIKEIFLGNIASGSDIRVPITLNQFDSIYLCMVKEIAIRASNIQTLYSQASQNNKKWEFKFWNDADQFTDWYSQAEDNKYYTIKRNGSNTQSGTLELKITSTNSPSDIENLSVLMRFKNYITESTINNLIQ